MASTRLPNCKVMLIPIAAGADADVETCGQLDKGARGVLDFFPDGGGTSLFVEFHDHGLGARERCSRIPIASHALFILSSRLLL